ncbi:MAG: C80 family cysteine peptidase [Candidatus Sericytochromatia bacterium]
MPVGPALPPRSLSGLSSAATPALAPPARTAPASVPAAGPSQPAVRPPSSGAAPLDPVRDGAQMAAQLEQTPASTLRKNQPPASVTPLALQRALGGTQTKAVYVLGAVGDPVLTKSAAHLLGKAGGEHSAFSAGELGKLGKQDKLTLIAHGSPDGQQVGGLSPRQLAEHLRDQGVRELQTLSLKSCDSAPFAQALARELEAVGVRVERITGRTGEVAIAANGRTLVKDASGTLLHQAAGSKVALQGPKSVDPYAVHSAASVADRSAEFVALGHGGLLAIRRQDIAPGASVRGFIDQLRAHAEFGNLPPSVQRLIGELRDQLSADGSQDPPILGARRSQPAPALSADLRMGQLTQLQINRRITDAQLHAVSFALGERYVPPGTGSLGALRLGEDGQIHDRPGFSRATISELDVAPGEARRHITAWHTIRGSVNQLLAEGLNPAEIVTAAVGDPAVYPGVSEARLTEIDALVAERPLGERGLLKLMFIMNSNPNNLWIGDGNTNSTINGASMQITGGLQNALAAQNPGLALTALVQQWGNPPADLHPVFRQAYQDAAAILQTAAQENLTPQAAAVRVQTQLLADFEADTGRYDAAPSLQALAARPRVAVPAHEHPYAVAGRELYLGRSGDQALSVGQRLAHLRLLANYTPEAAQIPVVQGPQAMEIEDP